MILEDTIRGLNPKYDPCILKIERDTAIFVGQGTKKSCFLKIFKSQYLKITFSNMGLTALLHSFPGDGQNDLCI